MSRLLRLALKSLTASALVLIGSSTGADARNGWNPIELVYKTADLGLSAGINATDFFLDIGHAATVQPDLTITRNETLFLPVATSKRSGWRGIVDIEIERAPSLNYGSIQAFDDRFFQAERTKEMRGFYTMRYHFDTGMDFVPYAGAGLGIVTKGTEAEVGGTVAGRATAGFDLNLAAETAVFAEYAFMKSGGVAFGNGQDGAGQTVPDNEHSLKLGFRRQF